MSYRNLLAAVSSTFIAACGGGGGYAGWSPFPAPVAGPAAAPSPAPSPSPSPAPTPAPAPGPAPSPSPAPGLSAIEGVYAGTSRNRTTTYDFSIAVLETGEVWAIYGQNGIARGAVHGFAAPGGATTFSGAGKEFFLSTGAVSSVSFSGTFATKASIAGTIPHDNATFSGVYVPAYDVPATPADIAGTWSGQVASPAGFQSLTVTIDGAGAFQGVVNGCSLSGSATPRPTGKAIFDTHVTFGPAPCVFANQTLTGISVVSDGTLFTAAVTSSGQSGFISTGTRQ